MKVMESLTHSSIMNGENKENLLKALKNVVIAPLPLTDI